MPEIVLAPSRHAPVATSVPNLRHLEYVHDHAPLNSLLFDGALVSVHGSVMPDEHRAGCGMT
jgi:hypothetical protein